MSLANEFYDPGEQRAAKVSALFANIATRYDRINDLQSLGLHRRWKHRVVELAAAEPGVDALDVCCGTGDLALALANHGAKVVGLDFSAAMLDMARIRSEKSTVGSRKPAKDISFIHGDAQKIPFADGTFDIVTVGYGLRNLTRWETGLREMVRVAKPGGRILVLDFGKPDNPLWRAAYFGYLRLCVPLFGLVFCRNAAAYAYILESLKHYPAQRGVEIMMARLGLVNVRTENILGGAMSINFGQKA